MTVWTLGGTAIPYPNSFAVEEFDIDLTDRVASGKLVTDIIATKKRFKLQYDYLSLEEIAVFNAVRNTRDFVRFVYKYLGVDQSVTVWMHPMTYKGEFQDPETWSNFSIYLEEQ